eukprot:g41602.t1
MQKSTRSGCSSAQGSGTTRLLCLWLASELLCRDARDILSRRDIVSQMFCVHHRHSHDQEEDVKWGVNCYRSLKPFLQEPEYKAFAAFCELAGDIDPDSRFEGPRAEITSESITK